jgi:hypothetical protein
MPTGNGVSGQYGDCRIGASELLETTKWEFAGKSTNAKYNSNKTGGFKRTIPGVKEGSGTLTGVLDPTNPIESQFGASIAGGAVVQLKLYTTAVSYYSMQAVIGEVKTMVDIDTGAIIGWTATFDADGAWTYSGSSEMAAPPPDDGADDATPHETETPVPAPASVAATVEQHVATLKPALVKEVAEAVVLALRDYLPRYVNAPAAQESMQQAA